MWRECRPSVSIDDAATALRSCGALRELQRRPRQGPLRCRPAWQPPSGSPGSSTIFTSAAVSVFLTGRFRCDPGRRLVRRIYRRHLLNQALPQTCRIAVLRGRTFGLTTLAYRSGGNLDQRADAGISVSKNTDGLRGGWPPFDGSRPIDAMRSRAPLQKPKTANNGRGQSCPLTPRTICSTCPTLSRSRS
jgi:hypothetical protein